MITTIIDYTILVLLILGLIFCFYQVLISLFGLYRKKYPEVKEIKYHTFAAVIAARNEEKVIGYLIDSLKQQNYPKDKLDIFVVADNCTDNTAEIARQHGAIVYERFNDKERGKGYALNYLLNIILNQHEKQYDAFCVFDADNLVHKDFIDRMNYMLCCGYEICQGYRDMKNPSDTWVTGNYSLFYWTQSRFYNQSRFNLGLSSQINGTGYMVKFDVFKESGWCTNSMTEDIEFTFKSIAEGRFIAFAHDAIVYDEQPLTFKQSWKQRMRWSTGYIQCMGLWMGKLLKRAIKDKDFRAFDGFLYFAALPVLFIGIFIGILFNFSSLSPRNMLMTSQLYSILRFMAGLYIFPVLVACLVAILEDKKLSSVYKGILTYPIFNLTWLVLNVICVFKRTTVWHPIEHTRAIDIKSLSQENK